MPTTVTHLLADLNRAADSVAEVFDNGFEVFAWKQGTRGGRYWLRDGAEDKATNSVYGKRAELAAAAGTGGGSSRRQSTAVRQDSAPVPGSVREIHPDGIHVDPSRFQFKLGTDSKTGTGKELHSVGVYNPELAGVLAVWRDPENGKDWVVNGHHRLELAKRTGAPNVAVRYLKAANAQEARAKGALINIAEGRGTAIDAAKFLRDTGTTPDNLKSVGISLHGSVARDANALRHLDDGLFHRLATGGMDLPRAVAISSHLPRHEDQRQLVGYIARQEKKTGRPVQPATVAEMAREMAATPRGTVAGQAGGLFDLGGDDESHFLHRAELKSHIRNELARTARDFRLLGSKRRAVNVATAGNVIDPTKNRTVADTTDAVLAEFDKRANLSGSVSDTINVHLKEYANATRPADKDRIKRRAFEAVRKAVSETAFAEARGVGRGHSLVHRAAGGSHLVRRAATPHGSRVSRLAATSTFAEAQVVNLCDRIERVNAELAKLPAAHPQAVAFLAVRDRLRADLRGRIDCFGSVLPRPTDKPFAVAVDRILADPATFLRHVPPQAVEQVKAKVKQVADFTREQLDKAIEQVRIERAGPQTSNRQALLAFEAILGEIAGLASGRPSVLANSESVHRFGWQGARSRTGSTKAVGTGPNAGQVLYGADAEKALASKGENAGGKKMDPVESFERGSQGHSILGSALEYAGVLGLSVPVLGQTSAEVARVAAAKADQKLASSKYGKRKATQRLKQAKRMLPYGLAAAGITGANHVIREWSKPGVGVETIGKVMKWIGFAETERFADSQILPPANVVEQLVAALPAKLAGMTAADATAKLRKVEALRASLPVGHALAAPLLVVAAALGRQLRCPLPPARTGPAAKFADDSGPPGPPPRPGLQWKRETQRWIRPDGTDEPGRQDRDGSKATSTSKPSTASATKPTRDPVPADHELAAAAKTNLGGSGGVHQVNVGGRDYVLKEGRSTRRFGNEVAASDLAAIAGVNMPRTRTATMRGLPVTVADYIHGGRTIDQIGRGMKDPAAMTAALKKVPKADVDRVVLFDYLTGHTDRHNGNFMIDGNNRLHVIDREFTFDRRFGQSFRKPYFLDHLGGMGYTLDPATVKQMATAGRRMADHLKRTGDRSRAGVVEERLRVIESLARERTPTVGALVALGGKGVAPYGAGFLRRTIWKLRHAAQLHSERRAARTHPLANRPFGRA